MKNYRKIIPLALVVLMALACYSLVSNAVKENSDYNHYLSEARKYAELDITKYAIENYNKALSINRLPMFMWKWLNIMRDRKIQIQNS